jgi:putative peptidoglycan lipid II flippase
MRDTSTPFKISLFSVVLNIILSVILMKNFGFFGIALATSITSYFTLSNYYFLLIKIDRISFDVLKQFLMLILLGFVFAFVLFQIPSFFVKLNIILSLILIIFISIIFWFTLMILFKFIDFAAIKKVLTF